MKKLTSFLAIAMMALMSLTFTSCEDAEIADTLYGTWKGYMNIGLTWKNSYYASTTSEITFDTNGAYTTSGTGYWIDYYDGSARWDYVANRIEWSVNNGVIRIHFLDENTYAEIRNYSLNDDYFYGTMVSGNSTAEFKLVKTSRPSSWNYYWYGTTDWYNSWGYTSWAKKQEGSTRSASEATDSLQQVPEMIRVVNYQGNK